MGMMNSIFGGSGQQGGPAPQITMSFGGAPVGLNPSSLGNILGGLGMRIPPQ